MDYSVHPKNGVIELKAFAQVLHLDDQTNQCFEDISWNEGGDEGLIKEFVQVCATGKTPLVTGLDGLRALEIALASYESSRTNEAVSLTQD